MTASPGLADLQDFLDRLPNGDMQFVSLSAAAHSLDLGLNRATSCHLGQGFLSLPPPLA